jgi:hypothetical protein
LHEASQLLGQITGVARCAVASFYRVGKLLAYFSPTVNRSALLVSSFVFFYA